LDGDGLKRQLELSEAYALENGLELDTTYRDLGVSAFDGSNRESGALSKFLEMVRSGQVERGSYLLVESLDRLSRDHVIDALEPFVAIAINANVSELIISLTVMARAHEKSATKSLRLAKAWVSKRQNTNTKLTARAPSWLRLKPDRTEFELIPERAAVVQRILKSLRTASAATRLLSASTRKVSSRGRTVAAGMVAPSR
jgi:DNA invertase Pin-like site-specific DNA recombinase